MILIETKKSDCKLGYYFLDVTDNKVMPYVCINSMLDTVSSYSFLDSCFSDCNISKGQEELLIKNMHKGEPKKEYLYLDLEISNSVDIQALIDYLKDSFLEGVISIDMTDIQAVEALKSKGYLIYNTVKGNLNEG
jgi:hypothetical protein